MSLIKKPVNGMKDILPAEKQIRDYVQEVIRDTYVSYGFTPMETPVVESLTNLLSKQGGDNEKLIFKILKRGEKLKIDTAKTDNDLADSGLRYDLTVPLVRYYACHKEELMTPFKALQMGYVFRADRPQRGRFRQFMQCDIDMFGVSDTSAEIELITATCDALTRLTFRDFVVRINDRRLLKALASYAGFADEVHDSVFITLDKMDKIGSEGVQRELMENGGSPEGVDKLMELFCRTADMTDEEAIRFLAEALQDTLEAGVAESLLEIMETANTLKTDAYRLQFDLTLVRGMGYYTGTIFEVAMPAFGGSCGGGGRYDKMVGKFTGQDVPAVGFSIGFERIVMLLLESGFTIPHARNKTCFLVEKGMSPQRMGEIMQEAASRRKAGEDVLLVKMNKNKKFQKEQLALAGFTEIEEYYKEGLRM